MGSPSGSRRRNLIMILAGLIIFNVMSCTRPAGTLATFQSARSDELSISGQWNIIDVPPRSRVNAIHAALLPTGKVLIIAGSGNSPENFDAGSFTTLLWDPQTGQFSLIPTPDDMFCAGHTLLPDGKLLVAGGTQRYQKGTQPAHGASYSYEFDPQTQRYERVADMHHGRWYPTLVGPADGNALAVSGLDKSGQPLDGHHELFRRDISQWIELPALNRYFPTYPALFLTADGRLFYSASTAGYGHSDGAGRRPGLWNLADNSFTPVDGLRDPNLTETSTSVLLPPAQDQRVMVLGGGGIDDSAESTARTDIVDLRSPHPHFTPGADLAEPTRYLSAVILPDDTVLTTGGSRDYRGRGDSNNHIARIYDPATNTFRAAAPPQVGRNYHSEALLLPDGRVVTLGSERLGDDDNSTPGAFEQRIEVYSPPYLYRGSRPVLTVGPTVVPRGGTAEFATADPDSIVTAKLMRPSAVTHTTDVQQRSIALTVVRKDRAISVRVPAEAGLVPPGWYMLFVTDRAGTPSVARWVQVP